ncbi:polyketide synthase dehydratase domain-containing protein, partial [Streptomyces sp. NPDC093991]
AEDYGIHPALLDAALHPLLAVSEDEGLRLPFLWEGVTLLAVGARTVRVRITPQGGDALSVELYDGTGEPVAVAGSLTLRPVTAEQLASSVSAEADSLYRLAWHAAPQGGDASEVPGWAVVGADDVLPGTTDRYADVPALVAAMDAGEAAPALVLYAPRTLDAEATTTDALAAVQAWLADERLVDSRLVVVTRGAVATDGGDVADLAAAPVWGLIRSAQSEYPERFMLLDLDPATDAVTAEQVRAALAPGEPQVAVREGRVLVPRLVRAASDAGLVPPADAATWRLDTTGTGTLEGLALVPAPEAAAALEPGQVRISVRAAGVNFRDVLIGLGMYPGEAYIGSEIAGVVTDVADDVSEFVPGDRVLGLVPHSFGPVAVADARVVVPMPEGWSFEQAAV